MTIPTYDFLVSLFQSIGKVCSRCASHVVRDVYLMQLEMYISYMHMRLLARKMKQSSLRQQCFLESCECFLQLRVYCLCADV